MCSLAVAAAGARSSPPLPAARVEYALRIDSLHLEELEVAIRISGAPARFHLAMKVHPEYDARYWRYLAGMTVAGTADDAAAGIAREDSTLWSVTLPGGHGEVRYRVRVQQPPPGPRRSWMPYVRADGALINPPDVFLYVPELAQAPVKVAVDIPPGWRVATALEAAGAPTTLEAPDAATLLDSPMLLGALREWSFAEGGTTYHVVYWPLPLAAAFDTLGFVAEVRRIVVEAVGIFGRAPTDRYWFLIQDGAGDALEHRASVTIGVPSELLARDLRAPLSELAHEFFHSWNLVAIHPAGFNRLSYRAPERTPLLWLGEGVTLYYADALLRRAALAAPGSTRLDHLAALLERYSGSAAVRRVPPGQASLAAGNSPVTDPNATGGYYLQGELLGYVLDAAVRRSTGERRGLDDVMRALFERSRAPDDAGLTPRDVESVADSVCGCDLGAVFTDQVRGEGPIDLGPAVHRLGLRLAVDSVTAVDSAGQPTPDVRIGLDFTAPPGTLRLVMGDPNSALAMAGLRTGDELTAVDGKAVGTWPELQRALRELRVGARSVFDVRRAGQPLQVSAVLASYLRPRVRFTDAPGMTRLQLARREAWLAGR